VIAPLEVSVFRTVDYFTIARTADYAVCLVNIAIRQFTSEELLALRRPGHIPRSVRNYGSTCVNGMIGTV